MRNANSFYLYDLQGNRLSATNGATGVVYAPNGLNQQATGRQDDGTTGTSASRPAPVEQSTPVDTRRLKV